ncbi:TetR/AcrR family transcriptional regulator [Sediminispirochaeta bajacaliforniensis]|uniref:TetR/AcrR family transcriptional regulator n=1 Tax=Sediminispirochaeta bajacaliforniensis TaxID=148 RepID=UPI0003610C40|nr:TetR/AcrR family transcriptional regulator [Sediminispirochaeta bajacaliforniensis]
MRKSKRDYADVDNRSRIIDAATELFIKQGAQDTSLSDIARSLSISKGTLYYYYSSKADLLFDVSESYMTRISNRLLEWAKNLKKPMPADEVVGKVLKELFSAENRGKLHLYLIYESITNNDMLKKRLISAYDQWLVMIKEGLSVLMNDTEKVAEYAELLLIMITGGIVHSTLGFGPQRIDGIMSLIFSGNPA